MGNTNMSNADANRWAANFMAQIDEISGASGDVDAFAAAIDEKLGDGTVNTAEEMRERVEGTDAEERVNQILDDYQNNSTTPSTQQIKRLIVERADNGTSDASDLSGAQLNDAVQNALQEFSQKWQNNWASAFGY